MNYKFDPKKIDEFVESYINDFYNNRKSKYDIPNDLVIELNNSLKESFKEYEIGYITNKEINNRVIDILIDYFKLKVQPPPS